MQISKIKIGTVYRHKDHTNYCYAKVIEILKPKQGDNTTNKTLVKCIYSQANGDDFGLIKYFKASDLVEMK